MITNKNFSEAFLIFAKYGDGIRSVWAENDLIHAGPEYKNVSKEDKKKLKKLGWNIDKRFGHFLYVTYIR